MSFPKFKPFNTIVPPDVDTDDGLALMITGAWYETICDDAGDDCPNTVICTL